MTEIITSQEVVLKGYKRFGNLCREIVRQLDMKNPQDIDYVSDYGRRIYFTNLDGFEYCVRLWTIEKLGEKYLIRFSLFKD